MRLYSHGSPTKAEAADSRYTATVKRPTAPDEHDALPRRARWVAQVPASGASDDRIAQEPSIKRWQRCNGVLHHSELDRPARELESPVEQWHRRAATKREIHRASIGLQLVRDLAPRLAASNDQDAARWQLTRPPVVARVQLQDSGRYATVCGRRCRALEGTSCHHDVRGLDSAVRRVQDESVGASHELQYTHSRTHRRAAPDCKTLEIRDRLGSGQKALRVCSIVPMPGQVQKEARRVETEAIPALRPPGLGDLALLDHSVLTLPLREVVTAGEPCRASADDHRFAALAHLAGRLPGTRATTLQWHGYPV
ncbi:MAG: hypothetical protein QOE87_4163 [Gaiellales bacterium]|nr:hypothetical protein [Gaiellales bacterium]